MVWRTCVYGRRTVVSMRAWHSVWVSGGCHVGLGCEASSKARPRRCVWWNRPGVVFSHLPWLDVFELRVTSTSIREVLWAFRLSTRVPSSCSSSPATPLLHSVQQKHPIFSCFSHPSEALFRSLDSFDFRKVGWRLITPEIWSGGINKCPILSRKACEENKMKRGHVVELAWFYLWKPQT